MAPWLWNLCEPSFEALLHIVRMLPPECECTPSGGWSHLHTVNTAASLQDTCTYQHLVTVNTPHITQHSKYFYIHVKYFYKHEKIFFHAWDLKKCIMILWSVNIFQLIIVVACSGHGDKQWQWHMQIITWVTINCLCFQTRPLTLNMRTRVRAAHSLHTHTFVTLCLVTSIRGEVQQVRTKGLAVFSVL